MDALIPAPVDVAGPPQPAARPLTTRGPQRRPGAAVGLLVFSAFVVILNETTMGVAMPRLMADLSLTAGVVQWLTTAFLLTMAVVIPVTGLVIQRWTTRAVFLSAMVLFTLGTLASAAAPDFGFLLGGRVLQAGGTALMMPLLMTTVMTVTPPLRRGAAMAKIAVVIAVAPALGPTISGAILDTLGWRWIFILMLPLALAALALGASWLPDLGETRPVRIDLASLLMAPVAFGGIVWGLSLIGEASHGAAPVPPWLPIAVGAVALAAFVRRQLALRHRADPLLDVSTLAEPGFRYAVVLLAAAMMALFAVVILLPLFAQQVLGLSPLATGLLILPGGVAMAALAPPVGRAYDRWGPRGLVLAGMSAVAAAAGGLALLTPTSPAWVVLGLNLVFSVGLALAMTPLFTAGLSALPPERYSHGSAVVGTTQQVAGAAGIALVVTVMTLVAAGATAAGADEISATPTGIKTGFAVCAALGALAVPLGLTLQRPSPAEVPAIVTDQRGRSEDARTTS